MRQAVIQAGCLVLGSAIAARFILIYGRARLPIWRPVMPSASIRRVVGGAKSLRFKEPIGKSKYALIVSLRAPVQVDLYTPIETAIGVPVEIEV